MSQAEVAENDPRGSLGSDPGRDPSSEPKDKPKDDPQKRDSMRRKRGPCSAFTDVFAAALTAQQTQILALNSDCPAELVGALTLL